MTIMWWCAPSIAKWKVCTFIYNLVKKVVLRPWKNYPTKNVMCSKPCKTLKEPSHFKLKSRFNRVKWPCGYRKGQHCLNNVWIKLWEESGPSGQKQYWWRFVGRETPFLAPKEVETAIWANLEDFLGKRTKYKFFSFSGARWAFDWKTHDWKTKNLRWFAPSFAQF